MNRRIGFRILKVHFALALVLLSFQNCSPGFIAGGASVGPLSTAALSSSSAYGKNGLRRLTGVELTNSVKDIFGTDASSLIGNLPSDDHQTIPFANEYGTQAIAPVTIENYNTFAEAYSEMVVAPGNFMTTFANQAGCTPKGVTDRACFLQYLTKMGSRILRRPVDAVEAGAYADAFLPVAQSENNFKTAVLLAVQAWLQTPEFLYRVQAGSGIESEPGLMALTDYEIATELAFLIWGRTPDDALEAKAQAGVLKLADERIKEVQRMMLDPKAKEQWQRFHAQWLGYDTAALPMTLASDMNQESNMLVNRIVFDQNLDWLKLFQFDETYLTPALATQYGLSGVSKPGWVKYSGGRGGGILAHATFLSKGSKFGDTSPTLRGYETFKRLMCGALGPVPDGVDIDSPPGNPNDCKPTRYFMRTVASCAGCHNITDNIGFGLENFGPAGEWRTTEPGKPNCAIDNAGSVAGTSYSGPAALGKLLSSNPQVAQCAVTQLFRFYTGRKDRVEDKGVLNALNAEYLGNGTLQSLIFALVRSPGFAYKVQ